MRSAGSVGRIVGVLVLVHLAVALIVPFILLQPLVTPPGFLVNAAPAAGQVRAAVFLFFAGTAVAIGIAIVALPAFRRHSPAMAYWVLALAVAGFSLQAVDSGAILSMLSLSQAYTRADGADADLLRAVGVAVGSARRWAHYTYLLVAVSWILLLYGVLYRFALVPRALAACGVVASMLQIAGVSVRGLLGYSPVTMLAIPLAPVHVALGAWLIAKGFDDGQPPPRAGGQGAELAGA
jgi:hypothetical protein